MRGAGRIGGRSFKMPQKQRANFGEDLFNVVSPIGLYDLPVSPRLEPINDEWSISNLNDPVDAKDCAAYPASPYCDGMFLDIKPFWYRIEIRSNECETCVYTYPIIGFMVLQPMIVCKRDPNCGKKKEPIDRSAFKLPKKLDENVQAEQYKSPECAKRESSINRYLNWRNNESANALSQALQGESSGGYEFRNINTAQTTETYKVEVNFPTTEKDTGCVDNYFWVYPVIDDSGQVEKHSFAFHKLGDIRTVTFISVGAERREINFPNQDWQETGSTYVFATWEPAKCCGMDTPPEIKPPPPPPPPNGDDDDRDKNKKKSKRDKKMCCNSCNDSADLSREILKELKAANLSREILKEVKGAREAIGSGIISVPKSFDSTLKNDPSKTSDLTQSLEYFSKLIAGRLGTGEYPMQVPESLLLKDLKSKNPKFKKLENHTSLLNWLLEKVSPFFVETEITIEGPQAKLTKEQIKKKDKIERIFFPNGIHLAAETFKMMLLSQRPPYYPNEDPTPPKSTTTTNPTTTTKPITPTPPTPMETLAANMEKVLKILGPGVISVPKSFDSTLKNDPSKTSDLTQSLEYFSKLIAGRLGTGRYPIEVPESLLTGVGDKTQDVESQTDYLYWLTHQIDALIGEFPIKIKIKDIDPLKEGDQEQEIVIPNIAEAIAEMYGITMKSGINQEVELNMLLRLAAEVIATKNGVAITQDYARANADFLGYKGNKVSRELTYNFDLARPDLLSGETPIVIESLLKTVTGSVEGWKNDDKQTLMDYVKRLMFAAGIVKAAFFRNKKQVTDIKKGIDDMYGDNKATKNHFEEFVQAIKNPQSDYNKNSTEKPDIKKQIKDPNKLSI